MIKVEQKGFTVSYTNHKGESSAIRVTEDVGALFVAAPDFYNVCNNL